MFCASPVSLLLNVQLSVYGRRKFFELIQTKKLLHRRRTVFAKDWDTFQSLIGVTNMRDYSNGLAIETGRNGSEKEQKDDHTHAQR